VYFHSTHCRHLTLRAYADAGRCIPTRNRSVSPLHTPGALDPETGLTTELPVSAPDTDLPESPTGQRTRTPNRECLTRRAVSSISPCTEGKLPLNRQLEVVPSVSGPAPRPTGQPLSGAPICWQLCPLELGICAPAVGYGHL
jgi:hypothetical protein